MMFDVNYFLEVLPKIASRADVTLRIALVATVFALLIGVVIAVIAYYKVKILYPLTRVYVSIMRGTPTVAQLFLFYYGMARVSDFILNLDPFTAVSIVLSCNVGAFMSESIRGALLSVDEGQKEAAYSLGMNNIQIARRIIIPQAIRVVLPPIFNDVISIIKASSLAFVIGIADIMGAAKIEGNVKYRYLEVYVAVMIVYWVIITFFGILHKLLEKKCADAY